MHVALHMSAAHVRWVLQRRNQQIAEHNLFMPEGHLGGAVARERHMLQNTFFCQHILP
jgi:hypothetical protein